MRIKKSVREELATYHAALASSPVARSKWPGSDADATMGLSAAAKKAQWALFDRTIIPDCDAAEEEWSVYYAEMEARWRESK